MFGAGRWLELHSGARMRVRGYVIIHELAHHFGSKDIAYGPGDCQQLDGSTAMNNADSFSLFVQAALGN